MRIISDMSFKAGDLVRYSSGYGVVWGHHCRERNIPTDSVFKVIRLGSYNCFYAEGYKKAYYAPYFKKVNLHAFNLEDFL